MTIFGGSKWPPCLPRTRWKGWATLSRGFGGCRGPCGLQKSAISGAGRDRGAGVFLYGSLMGHGAEHPMRHGHQSDGRSIVIQVFRCPLPRHPTSHIFESRVRMAPLPPKNQWERVDPPCPGGLGDAAGRLDSRSRQFPEPAETEGLGSSFTDHSWDMEPSAQCVTGIKVMVDPS